MKRLVFIVLIVGWCAAFVFLFYLLVRGLALIYFDFGVDAALGLIIYFFSGFFIRAELPTFWNSLTKYLVVLFDGSIRL